MKKRGWIALIGSLALVLVLSFLCGEFLIPIIKDKDKDYTYSETNCLTDKITEDMNIYDIAKLYRDSNATIEVIGYLEDSDGTPYMSLGSGVVVASTGYQTTTLNTQIKASKGSYIATNYHVVEFLYSPVYYNQSILVRAEDEVEYNCEVLWSDKNLDLAILYAEVSFDYVRMVDRWVDCSEENKLDYEDIFTIGSPLETQYLNRLTVGNIASDNELVMYTGQYVYPYLSGNEMLYSYEETTSTQEYTVVLDNVYEGVIDVALGISGGNSGGGCYDAHGNLFGLTTLGSTADYTDGNQMNGVVAIYPVMKIIDKLISNNEANTNYTIFTLGTLGLTGIDAEEAYYATYIKNKTEFSHYFVNDKFYSSSYASQFNFRDNGYCILTNSNSYTALNGIKQGAIITSYKINDGTSIAIENRNDLIYALLNVSNGDTLTFNYKITSGLGITTTSSSTVTL